MSVTPNVTTQSPPPTPSITLAAILSKRGTVPPLDALTVVRRLLRLLEGIHNQGQIHRNINTTTVSIVERQKLRLAASAASVTFGKTVPNAAIGPTVLNEHPRIDVPADVEQAMLVFSHNDIDLDPHQIDFFQVGALICEILCGESADRYLRSARSRAKAPQSIRPLIDHLLGDKETLFKSTHEAINAVKEAIDSLPEEDKAPKEPPETESRELKHIGPWRIEEKIGHGGMGDVYKAMHVNTRQIAALKVLAPALARDEVLVRRFHAESSTLGQLQHQNIVEFFEEGEAEGHHYLAMQYIPGESLAKNLEAGEPITVRDSLTVMRQALTGLSAAHELGFVHRDIKPDNILIDAKSKRVLLADFGLARAMESSAHLTMTHMIIGTVGYIAPEQAQGKTVDHRADIYAMGVLFYQLLAGRLPFETNSFTTMMFQHAFEQPPPLSAVAPHVPVGLTIIVERMMAKDPEGRYASAAEVLTELEGAEIEERETEEPSSHRSRILDMSIGLVFIAIAAAAVTIAIMSQKPNNDPPPVITTNLVESIDIDASIIAGKWSRGLTEAGAKYINNSSSPARLAFPISERDNFEVSIDLKRASGEGHLEIVFPVATSQVALLIDGWPQLGGRTGLDQINGVAAAVNATSLQGMQIEEGTDYTLTIKVTTSDQASIDARLNGKILVNWGGNPDELSAHPSLAISRDRLAIGTDNGEIQIKRVEIKPLEN